MNIWMRLQRIDRRIIYSLLLAVMVAGFFIKGVGQMVSKNTEDVYRCVEQLAGDNGKPGAYEKIALLVFDGGGATVGENVPQMEGVVRHLMKRNVKVAFMAFDPQGKEISRDLGERIAAEFGKKYGEDWVHLGYFIATQVVYQTLVKDFYKVVKQDNQGTPIRDISMMKKMRNIHDVGFIFHVAGSAMIGYWLSFVKNEINAPITGGCTGVLNADYANVYNTGQLSGYLGGMAGAAEYEGLLGLMGRATRAMQVQNYGHLLIMLFIVIGNIGYFVTRRQEAKLRGGAAKKGSA